MIGRGKTKVLGDNVPQFKASIKLPGLWLNLHYVLSNIVPPIP